MSADQVAAGGWLHRFSVVTAAATLLLVAAGGVVTSTDSGLAVPDWPLAYGLVFPPMVGGILYEHGHRIVATLVGLLTVGLAIWLWKREQRNWLRRLGLLAVAAVICQGVLGGLTVLYLLPTPVSVAHACLAQTFFCLTVAIALFTSPGWQSSPEVPPDGDRIALRTLALATTIVVYVQLFLGAVVRHTEAGPAIPDFPLSFGGVVPPISSLTIDPTIPFPPSPETQVHRVLIHFVHRAWAVVVLGATAWTSVRVLRRHPRVGSLRWPAAAVLVLVPLQILLGASVVWTEMAASVTTAHVVVGAAILASSLLVLLNAWRVPVRPVASDRAGTAAPGGGAAR